MIALVPLTYLILLIWLKLSFKKIELLELLASTNLILLGLAGLVPFLLREYAGIGYKYSIFEIMAVALALITYELVAKRKLIFFRADSSIQENTELKLGDELNADMSSSLGGKLALSVRGGRHNLISLAKELSAPVIFLMIFGVILISRGFYLPIRGWDAISLYDARARMFLSGLSLGELKTLSQYDDFNYYYYLSYPPMTSVIHTTLYSTGFSGVMWVYALFYMSFIYYLYLLLKKLEINRLLKISLFAAVAFNPLIIGQMNIAYTNLPMMAFQTGSLYYLIKYIWDRNNKFLIISAMLLSFANWTRNLEPIFIGFVLATLYAVFTYKKLHILKKMILSIVYTAISLLTRTVWTYYLRNSVGSIGDTTPSFNILISRLADSLYLGNLVGIVFFIFTALTPILLYILLMGIGLVWRNLHSKRRHSLIETALVIVFITMVALMLGGTLYFSTTFTWWDKIGGSFLRSNMLIIPLAVIYVAFVMEK